MYFTDSGDGPAGSETIVYLGPSNEVRLEDYSYNDGYSSEDGAIVYPALPDIVTGKQIGRAHV